MEKGIVSFAEKINKAGKQMAKSAITLVRPSIQLNITFKVTKGDVISECTGSIYAYITNDGLLKVEESDLYDIGSDKLQGDEVKDLGKLKMHLYSIGLVESTNDIITREELEDAFNVLKYEALADFAEATPFIKGHDLFEGGVKMK